MKTIGVVTVARSDYGIYRPVLQAIREETDLDLCLMVSGMHLSPEFGLTVNIIKDDGFEIYDRIEMLLSSDTPEGITKSMGLGTIGFAQSYAKFPPDILLVLGDRFEMHAAVIAALPFNIPVAHLHGGEVTEGAIDEAFRHSITKMSHLHFVSTESYARRVMQMGEEPWRVHISGAPALDNLNDISLLNCGELESLLGVNFSKPVLLVTYHPVTLEQGQTEYQMKSLLEALKSSELEVIFTYPNADAQGRLIIDMIHTFVQGSERANVAQNLGTEAYFSLMKHAAVMVGNSSSGILEAASFKLPVVNIGNRQKGRARSKNVIDVGYRKNEIDEGIQKGLSNSFRADLEDLVNPYGDGQAAKRIIEVLKKIDVDEKLLVKRFCDIESKSK